MQILNIKAENFKGIKLVEVVPEKTTTIIGGKNRQGKSSLLDAVAATLGGAKLCPKEPIRDGQDTATVKISLDGEEKRLMPPCVVTRTWRRRSNGTVASELEIITADGYKAPTPQTILDDVVGRLGFDPERFLRMKPKEQADILRDLVGLDFSGLDDKRSKIYDRRAEINREIKRLESRLSSTAQHGDVPDEEVSVSALVAELQRRQKLNRDNNRARDELTCAEAKRGLVFEELEAARKKLREVEETLKKAVFSAATLKTTVAKLADHDEHVIEECIASSETVNRKVRENAERKRLADELTNTRKQSSDLTDEIAVIDADKQKMREAAKWPVPNLGYDENGVTLLNRPFEQASATEQRKAAFGIVAALSPSLKFSMIKDGSLLDDDSLADFGRIAAESGFQLFIERVSEGGECTIVISDGEIKEDRDADAAE